MSEFYQTVLEEIGKTLPEIDANDTEGQAIRQAHLYKIAADELGNSRQQIDRAMLHLLADVERNKTYLIDGSEASELYEWCESIESLQPLMAENDSMLKRMISSIVSMVIPIEMKQIKATFRTQDEDGVIYEEERFITADDIIKAGNRVVKEMAHHFATAESDEDQEDIAIALVEGKGREKLSELREKKKAVFIPFTFFMREKADGGVELFAELKQEELSALEMRVKGLAEFQYEPRQGSGEEYSD